MPSDDIRFSWDQASRSDTRDLFFKAISNTVLPECVYLFDSCCEKITIIILKHAVARACQI